jgi:hypothetical protein
MWKALFPYILIVIGLALALWIVLIAWSTQL